MILINIILSGCSDKISLQYKESETITPRITEISNITVSETISFTISPSLTSTSSVTPEPTHTPTPSLTSSPTITPTYSIIRGEVNVNVLACKFGPAYMYLFKYPLYEGDYLEIIGRNEQGTWLLIRAIGGTNPCWVKGIFMDLEGDVMSVAPTDMHIVMPWTYMPGFYKLSGVTAIREGDTVKLSWNYMGMIAGDDFDLTNQAPYIVEAWVCQNREIVELIIGAWNNYSEVIDEIGCEIASSGRVLGTEKHGYTEPFYFVWPETAATKTP